MSFPPVPLELLTELEARFRDQVPRITDSDRQVWAKVGNVEVVRFLREQFNQQNETVLATPVINDVHPEGTLRGR